MWAIKRLLLVVLYVELSVGCGYGQSGKEHAGRAPHIEQFVDVGGRRLHFICSGASGEGGPTVVLEAGFGNSSSTWDRVQPDVAKFARVCSYDRAGLGASDPAPAQRTVVSLTEDLHAFLVNAKVRGPYVLVGHSLGGLLARVYASYYPKDVVAMVLVDSTHEDEADRGLLLLPPETLKDMARRAKPVDMVVSNPAE